MNHIYAQSQRLNEIHYTEMHAQNEIIICCKLQTEHDDIYYMESKNKEYSIEKNRQTLKFSEP